jgi:rhodanese-related sulfurtransferase
VAAIVAAAGGHAEVKTALSAIDVRSLELPIIANVRTPTATTYDHWVTVSWDGSNVVLQDVWEEPVQMPLAEFLAIWNGLGVVVSGGDSGSTATVWFSRLFLFEVAIAIGIGLRVLIRRTYARTPSLRLQLTTFSVAVVLMAAIGLSVFADVLNYSAAMTLTLQPFRSGTINQGTLDQALALSQEGRCLLIDARYESDFRSGSIPRAVNIPVYASLWQIRDFLEGVNRDIPIAVYCQSEHCDYDEVVSQNLSLLGFRNVTVCDVGWKEYSARYTQHKRGKRAGRPAPTQQSTIQL